MRNMRANPILMYPAIRNPPFPVRSWKNEFQPMIVVTYWMPFPRLGFCFDVYCEAILSYPCNPPWQTLKNLEQEEKVFCCDFYVQVAGTINSISPGFHTATVLELDLFISLILSARTSSSIHHQDKRTSKQKMWPFARPKKDITEGRQVPKIPQIQAHAQFNIINDSIAFTERMSLVLFL